MSDHSTQGFNVHSSKFTRAISKSDCNSTDLSHLSRELFLIASQIANFPQKNPDSIFSSTSELLAEIRRTRLLRTQFFADELFADPAWDILLELKHAENEQFRVPISKLCAAAAVPATTALRWIANMVDQGILIRIDDPLDNRRTFIALHPTTSQKMEKFLHSVVLRADLGDPGKW